jgi:hypothetical protein
MKMKKLAIATLLVCAAPAAFAQTCPTTATALTGSGDTCALVAGNPKPNNYATVCGSLTNVGPTDAYLLPPVGATANFTVTVTPTLATYDAAIFLIGPNACNQATGCGNGVSPFAADNAGPGPTGAEAIVATTATGAAPGSYYLVVGSTAGSNQASGGCGAYNFAITGQLPVKLNGFSVN